MYHTHSEAASIVAGRAAAAPALFSLYAGVRARVVDGGLCGDRVSPSALGGTPPDADSASPFIVALCAQDTLPLSCSHVEGVE